MSGEGFDSLTSFGDSRLMFLPIETIQLRNLLSFGPDTEPFELRALNVLIGANGSGKSNFIEGIELLHALTRDMREHFRNRGGAQDWAWKGVKERKPFRIDVWGYFRTRRPYHHHIAVATAETTPEVVDESITISEKSGRIQALPTFGFERQVPVHRWKGALTKLNPKRFVNNQSVLKDTRGDEEYVPLFLSLMPVANLYPRFTFHRARSLDLNIDMRNWQPSDLSGQRLEESGRNLTAVLTRIRSDLEIRGEFKRLMSEFYKDFSDIEIETYGGQSRVIMFEDQMKSSMPAARLSDGTLRWLALVALLLDPRRRL